MSEQLIKLLLKAITYVPGIVGIANLDFAKEPTKLEEKFWLKGIEFKNTSSGFEFSVAIMVDKNIKAKIIVGELESSISRLLEQKKIAPTKLNIYVRGIE